MPANYENSDNIATDCNGGISSSQRAGKPKIG